MDVHDKLDEITALVQDARAMPMSASALINRADVLARLKELREMLPNQLADADSLLSDRAAVLESGRNQADRLLADAQSEHDRLVEQSEVVSSARGRAAQVQLTAQGECRRLRSEADDYVDRRLGEFEIALDKLTAQVQRGRERLAERRVDDVDAAPLDLAEAGRVGQQEAGLGQRGVVR